MPLVRRFLPALYASLMVGISGASAGEAQSDTKDFRADYQFYLGGARIADATLSGSLGVVTYDIQTTLETQGMFHMLQIQALLTARAEGQNQGRGELQPNRYRSEYTTDGDTGTLSITYDGHTPAVAAEPPIVPTAYGDDTADTSGTMDPLSAVLKAMTPDTADGICNRTIRVFDGTRRYDIHLLPEGRRPEPKQFQPLDLDHPVQRCFGVYDRISGFERDNRTEQQVGKRYYPFDIWFEVSPSGVHRIARVAGRTSLGHIVGLLRP